MVLRLWVPQSPRAGVQQGLRQVLKLPFSVLASSFLLFLQTLFLKLPCPGTRKETELFGLLLFSLSLLTSVFYWPYPYDCVYPPLRRCLWNKGDDYKLCSIPQLDNLGGFGHKHLAAKMRTLIISCGLINDQSKGKQLYKLNIFQYLGVTF